MKKTLFAFVAALSVSGLAFAATKTDTIKVNGWHCDKCPAKTEAKLKSINGVRSAKTDRAKGEVVVTYDESKAKRADLEKAVADSGFAVEK